MAEHLLTYVTAGSHEEAKRIADALVQERLVACVNIYPAVTSVFEWQGEICHEEEVVLICKTTRAGFEPMKTRICALHSYDCPCVVALPVEAGHEPFTDWISETVRPS